MRNQHSFVEIAFLHGEDKDASRALQRDISRFYGWIPQREIFPDVFPMKR